MVEVTVVIPTFRRPASLRRALASCARQAHAPAFEVVVVDNCPDQSARDTVQGFASDAAVSVRYTHEARAGVAAARNTGVAAAHGRFIAFLDDDEEADANWLAALVATQRETGADAVFGAVIAEIDGAPPRDAELYLAPFTRLFSEPSGLVARRHVASLGTGNSLFDRAALGISPFDPALGLAGGEDSALIKRFVREERKLAWAREARVKEYLPADRANLTFLVKRRFSAGQVRTSTCVAAAPREPAQVLKWMAVGAVQVGVWGTLAAAASVVRPSAAKRFLCNASGGLGKVLWMPPFRVLRYPTQAARGGAGKAGPETP